MIKRGTKVKISRAKVVPKWARGREGIVSHQTIEGGMIGLRWQGMEEPYPETWTITVLRPELRGGYAFLSVHERYLKILEGEKIA